MFVYWKTRKLLTYNDRSDTECLHNGPDRQSWTPIVANSVWTARVPTTDGAWSLAGHPVVLRSGSLCRSDGGTAPPTSSSGRWRRSSTRAA